MFCCYFKNSGAPKDEKLFSMHLGKQIDFPSPEDCEARALQCRGSESDRLPPMWLRVQNLGVDVICGLSLFLVGSPLDFERFFPGYSGFPHSLRNNTSRFQFDQESSSRRTTWWIWYLQIFYFILHKLTLRRPPASSERNLINFFTKFSFLERFSASG